MSEVIRDAVIRLRIEQQKATLNSPQFKEAARGYQETAKAAKEAERAVSEFSFNSVRHLSHAGHGVLQLARGIALMSASSEEDTRKMLEQFAKIEAAVSLAKGAANIGKFAAEFGALGVATAGVSAIAVAGAIAWERHALAIEKAAAAARKKAEDDRLAAEAEKRLQESQLGIQAGGLARLTEAAISPRERRRREDREIAAIRLRQQGAETELSGLGIARGQAQREREAAAKQVAEGSRDDDSLIARTVRGVYGKDFGRPVGAIRQAEEAQKRDDEYKARSVALLQQQKDDQERLLEITQRRQREEAASMKAGGSVVGDVFKSLGLQGIGREGLDAAAIAQAAKHFGPAVDALVKAITESTAKLDKLTREQAAANSMEP